MVADTNTAADIDRTITAVSNHATARLGIKEAITSWFDGYKLASAVEFVVSTECFADEIRGAIVWVP